MKLKRADFFLGKEKAIAHVEHLAKTLGIPIPKRKDFNTTIVLPTENKTFHINFSDEVTHTIKHGKAKMLQSWFDAQDRFLQPAIEMSGHCSASGISIQLSSSIGSHTCTVSNHGILESPELALARDICFFHEETCRLYNLDDIHGFSRSFRSYLHSCVSLVDCFLFRYAFHTRDLIGNTEKFHNTAVLDSRAGVLERLDAWMQTFATCELENFKNWKERSQFIELRNKRNEFTHPSVPTVKFEPMEVTKLLNYGSTGIGALLAKMRKSSGTSCKIGFISQTVNLPRVTMQKNA